MATDPQFAATTHAAGILTSTTADTSLTAPTNVVTVFSAGASGSRIDQIRISQVITTAAAGIINLFLHDGSTYHFFDYFSYGITTLSATVQAPPADLYYQNLDIASGWSLRATNTVASNTGATSAATHKVIALGADY